MLYYTVLYCNRFRANAGGLDIASAEDAPPPFARSVLAVSIRKLST